jgi:hypothetical protein
MGICQSSALRVIVHEPECAKKTYYFSMKKMRSFRNLGELLSSSNVILDKKDRLFYQTYGGLAEIFPGSQFEIRSLIVKNRLGILKYRIVMESMY